MSGAPNWPPAERISPGAFAPDMQRSALLRSAAESAGVSIDAVEDAVADVAEPLELLLGSLTNEAELTDEGLQFTHRWMARLVSERVKIGEATDAAHGREQIVAPVIVAGAPRTGTTYLHGLLAQVEGHRAPQGWELLYPSPSPRQDTAAEDPRVAAADDELTWPQRQSTSMMSIHRYAARMHKECLSAMSFAFRSEEFVSRYHVPAYVDWLQSCDMKPAYEMHRRVLGLLQRRQRTAQWVLKSPVHLNNLPTVLATYPDARLVITHREPTEVLGSVTSLILNLRRAFSDRVDEGAVARYHLELYGRSLDALVDADLPPEQVAHVDQRSLIAEPQTTMDELCDRFGLATTQIDASPPVEAGQHDYSVAGIETDELDAVFGRYRERFLSGS